MKIIKLPVKPHIKCDCGCEFEFEVEELEHQIYCIGNQMYTKIIIPCPFCRRNHILKERIIEY